ncbi:hypothetical protein V8G54_035962 [Vigna mungo]|uniref:Uncharacterized protein n=1 Tax=Vigna mungo TaxID=3915 RepID=A0AAQ3REZ3_VIGMU
MQESKRRGGRRETTIECQKERKRRGVAREKGEEEDDRYKKLNAAKSCGVFKMELGGSEGPVCLRALPLASIDKISCWVLSRNKQSLSLDWNIGINQSNQIKSAVAMEEGAGCEIDGREF